MRRLLLALSLHCGRSPFAFPACAEDSRSPSITLAPGVFVHAGKTLPLDAPGHDDIANIGFIVGTRCVAVIDTGGSVRTGRALRAAIRQHTPLPVCYVINTHVHVDHVLGNAAFSGRQAAVRRSCALGAALARSRDFFLREYRRRLRCAGCRGPDHRARSGSNGYRSNSISAIASCGCARGRRRTPIAT